MMIWYRGHGNDFASRINEYAGKFRRRSIDKDGLGWS